MKAISALKLTLVSYLASPPTSDRSAPQAMARSQSARSYTHVSFFRNDLATLTMVCVIATASLSHERCAISMRADHGLKR